MDRSFVAVLMDGVSVGSQIVVPSDVELPPEVLRRETADPSRIEIWRLVGNSQWATSRTAHYAFERLADR